MIDDTACPFCEIATGKRRGHLVFETPTVVAFMDGYRQPIDPGHVLVIPREHIENIYGIDDALGGELFTAHARIARAVKRAFSPDGITTWSSNEPAGGQEVMHFHLHVFPRRRGIKLEEAVTLQQPEVPADGAVLESAAERIRAELSRSASSRPEIRPMEPRDAQAVARIHVRSWQVAYRGQLPDAFLDGLSAEIDQRRVRWERLIAEAASRRWTQLVTDAGGSVTGFVTFGPSREEPSVGEVYAIYVAPEHWGRGHGRALFSAAAQGLLNAGYDEATLWVLETNARARRFYEIAGWIADSAVRTERQGEVDLREVRYRRRAVGGAEVAQRSAG